MHDITHRLGETLHARSLVAPSITSGTEYPCSRFLLDNVTNPSGFLIQSPPLPTHQAARNLVHRLSGPLNYDEQIACDRLQRLNTIATPDWSPDIVQKTFHDLDTLLFAGRLATNVCVKWETIPNIRRYCRERGKRDHSRAIGFTTFVADEGSDRYGHARITMNADECFLENWEACWKEMWGTLLHEMGVSLILWEGLGRRADGSA